MTSRLHLIFSENRMKNVPTIKLR